MQASSTSKLKVGILMAVALVILAVGLISIGGHQKFFTRSDTFTAYFNSVGGLQSGAPVDFHGVRIGSVKDVSLPSDPKAKKIIVDISIERRYTPLIQSDTFAQIKTVGLLGDKFVLLSTDEDPKAVSLAPGTTIRTVEPVDYDELTRRSEDIVTNISVISSSLRQLLLSIEQGDTLLGQLLSDPEFGRDSFANLETILGDWGRISHSIESGQSLAGKILSDKAYGHRVGGDIEDTMARLHRVVSAVEEGRGLAGKLLMPSEENETMFKDLKAFSEALRIVADEMKAGDGFVPAMLRGTPEGKQSVRDFNATLHSLSSILDKIDNADGSAGMFVNNPEVYHSVENIVGAMNKSKTTKWYLHRKEKKGEKLRQKEEEAKRGAEEAGEPLSDSSLDSNVLEGAGGVHTTEAAVIPFVPSDAESYAPPERDPFAEPEPESP